MYLLDKVILWNYYKIIIIADEIIFIVRLQLITQILNQFFALKFSSKKKYKRIIRLLCKRTV